MPSFYELPRIEQMRLLRAATTFPTVYEVNKWYALKPRLSYSTKDPKRNLGDIRVSPNLFPNEHIEFLHHSRVKHEVMKLITMEPLITDLKLYNLWGFVIEDSGHPIVICQNLQPTDFQRVAVIQLQDFWATNLEEDTPTHTRVKMLWSAVAFGVLVESSHFLKN